MDIIAQLKAERNKAAQQVNVLDTAIRALSGLNSTGGNTRTPDDECRCTSTYLCLTESTLGTSAGSESCLHRSQAPHLSSRASTNQSSN
jgi:hypothetical protein